MKHTIRMVKMAGSRGGALRCLPGSAFTLIELLVSVTFLVILMMVVTQVIGIVQRTWVRANSRVSQFREARRAFDLISRNLSQATLNTYWTTDLTQLSSDALGQAIKAPTSYKRQSELHFICGPTADILSGASATTFPGHAVFFQAPLGVLRNDPQGTGGNTINTENLTNLLCGRGYFVELGTDANFRPAFLSTGNYSTIVPLKNRLRLMEYSPTAEMNGIYSTSFRTDPSTIRQWYQDPVSGVLASEVTSGNDNDQSGTTGRYFTRPIADNILALIISPQLENTNTNGTVSNTVYSIAPSYLYDSALVGAATSNTSPQGTQHLLPPLLKITMIALDERSGDYLGAETNATVQSTVMSGLSSLFTSASNYTTDLEGTPDSAGAVKTLLLGAKLNYRVFTTTIALRQARWSF